MLASGLLLAFAGAAALASRWLPLAFALTHLGTLGFLCSVMFGALYQMIPVVAGSPVPGARLAHAVHAGWARVEGHQGPCSARAGARAGGPSRRVTG